MSFRSGMTDSHTVKNKNKKKLKKIRINKEINKHIERRNRQHFQMSVGPKTDSGPLKLKIAVS